MTEPVSRHFDVEKTWDEFVAVIGGELVRNLLPGDPPIRNADYLFRADGVVCEMKTMRKDLLRSADIQAKLDKLYHRWAAQGLVPPIPAGRQKVDSKTLPEKCQIQWMNVLKRPLKEAVEKANKQIKQTKSHLDLPDARGLLLLVNDGNYTYELDVVAYLTSHLLKPRFDSSGNPKSARYKSIDTILYMTMNMPVVVGGTGVLGSDILMWGDFFRDSQQVERKFMDRLREQWWEFLSQKTGKPIPLLKNLEPSTISEARFTQEGREGGKL